MQQFQKQKGAALMVFLILFLMASISLTAMLARATYVDLVTLNSLRISKQSYLAAESVVEEVTQRLVFGAYSVDETETLTIGGATAYATTTEDLVNDILTIDGAGTIKRAVRKSRIELSIGTGSAFNYGLQAGNGGISLANSAEIIGNVYSNGPITGSGNSSMIRGDAVSAGPSGFIDDIRATGSARANEITDSTIDIDLHVENSFKDTLNVVGGTKYFYGAGNDPATTSFPINDDLVEEWKQAIEDSGTVIASTDPECSSGTYTIDDPATIGMIKIGCNLDIKDQGSPATTLTLTGPVWVEGNISFTSGPTIEVDSALGRRSVQMIADNESDRLTSSKIEVRNSTDFNGSGDSRSYIMLLSMNEDASQTVPAGEVAIDVGQSADGSLIVYAGHGLIEVGNGIDLKEITGYQIDVAQNSSIEYESGLQDLIFTSGPGGGYTIDDWSETY